MYSGLHFSTKSASHNEYEQLRILVTLARKEVRWQYRIKTLSQCVCVCVCVQELCGNGFTVSLSASQLRTLALFQQGSWLTVSVSNEWWLWHKSMTRCKGRYSFICRHDTSSYAYIMCTSQSPCCTKAQKQRKPQQQAELITHRLISLFHCNVNYIRLVSLTCHCEQLQYPQESHWNTDFKSSGVRRR